MPRNRSAWNGRRKRWGINPRFWLLPGAGCGYWPRALFQRCGRPDIRHLPGQTTGSLAWEEAWRLNDNLLAGQEEFKRKGLLGDTEYGEARDLWGTYKPCWMEAGIFPVKEPVWPCYWRRKTMWRKIPHPSTWLRTVQWDDVNAHCLTCQASSVTHWGPSNLFK